MTFEIYTDSTGEYRWRLRSISNGKIVADSGESYKNRCDLLHEIGKIKSSVATAEIVEATVG